MNVIKELLFPKRCPVCDGIVRPFGASICESCKEEFSYIRTCFCMKCGKGLRDKAGEYCRDCGSKRHLYKRGRAVFEYKTAAASIYRFKYGKRQEYADYFGDAAVSLLKEELEVMNPDALIPVPLHKSRLRARGYNQAELLANAIGRRIGVPAVTDLIVRCKKTEPLKLLNPVQRQNNLKKAFKIVRNDVKLKTIIIIDDVYTTGSTIDAMAAELMAAGVRTIYFVALAVGQGL